MDTQQVQEIIAKITRTKTGKGILKRNRGLNLLETY